MSRIFYLYHAKRTLFKQQSKQQKLKFEFLNKNLSSKKQLPSNLSSNKIELKVTELTAKFYIIQDVVKLSLRDVCVKLIKRVTFTKGTLEVSEGLTANLKV